MLQKVSFGRQPYGLVIKFSTLHFGGPGSIPGHGPMPIIGGHAVVIHIQNRGKLAQKLAQGKSSSAKKRKKKKFEWIKNLNVNSNITKLLGNRDKCFHALIIGKNFLSNMQNVQTLKENITNV